MNFSVAFWGSKSTLYMDDVVPAMLAGLESGNAIPLFTWSGKESTVTKLEGGIPSQRRKSLEVVYSKWPTFSATNTVIVDNQLNKVKERK